MKKKKYYDPKYDKLPLVIIRKYFDILTFEKFLELIYYEINNNIYTIELDKYGNTLQADFLNVEDKSLHFRVYFDPDKNEISYSWTTSKIEPTNLFKQLKKIKKMKQNG